MSFLSLIRFSVVNSVRRCRYNFVIKTIFDDMYFAAGLDDGIAHVDSVHSTENDERI